MRHPFECLLCRAILKPNSCPKVFTDQTQDRLLANTLAKLMNQQVMIDGIEVTFQVTIDTPFVAFLRRLAYPLDGGMGLASSLKSTSKSGPST